MSVGTEGIQGNVQILRLGSCRVCEGILETGIQGKDQIGGSRRWTQVSPC